jgi:hypothetical protein
MNTFRMLPAALCTSALLLSALSGCSKSESTPEEAASTASTDVHSGHDHSPVVVTDSGLIRSDSYEGVRGEITALPVEGDPSSQLRIHHEHIPAFKTKAGSINVNSKGVSGMRAMTMEFPPADGLSIEGLAVGDKIEFTFVVNWGGVRAWEVTKIEKLAADAVLDFSDKPIAVDDDALPEAPSEMDHGHDHDHDAEEHDEP